MSNFTYGSNANKWRYVEQIYYFLLSQGKPVLLSRCVQVPIKHCKYEKNAIDPKKSIMGAISKGVKNKKKSIVFVKYQGGICLAAIDLVNEWRLAYADNLTDARNLPNIRFQDITEIINHKKPSVNLKLTVEVEASGRETLIRIIDVYKDLARLPTYVRKKGHSLFSGANDVEVAVDLYEDFLKLKLQGVADRNAFEQLSNQKWKPQTVARYIKGIQGILRHVGLKVNYGISI